MRTLGSLNMDDVGKRVTVPKTGKSCLIVQIIHNPTGTLVYEVTDKHAIFDFSTTECEVTG